MTEIALENLSKRYARGPLALDRVNLQVREGELMVIVGPSGCGKTTLLRLIGGLEVPTAGTIRIGGRTVNTEHPSRRGVAMVFQDAALYSHMTAQRNIAFGLRMRKLPSAEIERRARQAAEIVGIMGLLDRRPGQLSGGERQRVALARAIAREPQCLLLDEPLSSLDAQLRTQMRAEIKTVQRRIRATTIHVTHDQEEAMTLGDRIAVIARGSIQQVGEPLEVYRRPANRFVAGFLGRPAMNFLNGAIDVIDGRPMFVEAGGVVRVALGDEALARVANQPAVLGVRPEDLLSQPRAESHGRGFVGFEITVTLTEVLGDQMNVHGVMRSKEPMIARMKAGSIPQRGEGLTLRAGTDRLHLFEPGEFGRRIEGQIAHRQNPCASPTP